MNRPARKSRRKSFRVFNRKSVGAPSVNAEVVARVTAKRLAAGVSLQDGASQIHRAPSTLFRMEIGATPMSAQEAETLLAFYAARAAEVVQDLTAAFQS